MRQDVGVDGDAQRISQLCWMFFLKIIDDQDQQLELMYPDYRSPIPKALQWRTWAANPEGITGEELQTFVNAELFPRLKALPASGKGQADRRRVVRDVFEDAYNYMKSGQLMRQVINKISAVDFNKRLLVTDHVLQRFSSRVPNNVGEDLCSFLLCLYGSPMISLPVGSGRAFIVQYGESVLAFTYKETDQEFVITTCLTINEMQSLSLEVPTPTFNFHYGSPFAKPKYRNWLPHQLATILHERWERKAPLRPLVSLPKTKSSNWHGVACRIKDIAQIQGNCPGTRLRFLDDIPGPAQMTIRPGQIAPQFDEANFQTTASLHPAPSGSKA